MDYIRKNIDNHIKIFATNGDQASQMVYVQAKFEYTLVFIIGYLWNKNYKLLVWHID